MRCKNCGFDNQEGRYICENCGSPLFDGNNEIIPEEDDIAAPVENNVQENTEEDGNDSIKDKRNIIIIIVLAVILVAMIVGIIVSAVTKNKEDDTTASEPSVSVTDEITEDKTTKHTTTKKATTEATTEEATKETTTETTTATTTQKKYYVTVDIDGSGKVTGDGSFTSGTRTTLTATPDEGYEFAGWYDNETKELKASNTKYTITVSSDISLTARFVKTSEVAPEQ